jgi:outer membrane protein OmpA-like peptidoglycan-associated protein
MNRAAILSFLILVLGAPTTLQAQTTVPAKPLEVTSTRESLAITYPEGPEIDVKFQGTYRLPSARGEAHVERKKGTTEIDIRLDELKPAHLFGGDYTTYVLWTVSPEGHVDNVGEFILEGDESKLEVTTNLGTFGMFVTAEPHFLVKSPSRFVVIENTRPEDNVTSAIIKVSQIRYRGFEGVYRFDRETLANLKEIEGELRSDVAQAHVAIDLAVRAGAETFAAAELAAAREALKNTMSSAAAGADRRNLMLEGHEVVRLAVEAQELAEQRSFQAALDRERKSHADETSQLEASIRAAQSEADRARLEAQQRELQLRMEENARLEAMKQADEQARRAAEAEQRANEANRQMELARREQDEARLRLRQALGAVAETRESARGLIVSLPDILFDFDKATLRQQGRETLAKIAGILLVARGFTLRLEGHTDNVGSDAYNFDLSLRRAGNVRDYLIQQGLPAAIMTAEGFGKTQPIASNATAEGRQQNRRVEIVIEGVEEFNSSR